jgi:hypothetical protein
MHIFTNGEYADMHFVLFFFCDGNPLPALREYEFRYPDQRLPDRRVLERVHHNVRETVALMTHAPSGWRRCSARDEEDVLDIMQGTTNLLLQSKEVMRMIFIALKNQSSSAGFTPAILGFICKHANHYITEGDYLN